MKQIARTIAVIVLLAGLAACASAGNVQLKDETQESISQKIVLHQTTKDQVRAAFGDPLRVVNTTTHHEIWVYGFAHATPTATSYIPVVGIFSNGSNIDTKQLLIEFDEQGVAVDDRYSDKQSETRHGISN
jgi:outer membrane protein assembly factor BamE (lipoprotein component of BamABCDE complex)